MKRVRQLSFILLLFVITISLGQATSSKLFATGPHTLYFPTIFRGASLPTTSAWIGPGGGAITDLVFDTGSPKTVYAAASGGGVYKSSDGGLTWSNASNGLGHLDLTALDVAPGNPLVLFAGTYKGGVYKSTDGGANWSASGTGIQAEAITYAIEVDPGSANQVYISTRGVSNDGAAPWNGVVYKTTNGGANWSPVLSNVGGSSEEDWAYDLAIHPLNPNVVYAATHEHGAYRSTDFGISWGPINSGISDLTARTIEPDPSDAYPGNTYLGVFERTGLFKSTNGGNNWSLEDQGISDARLYKLSIDPNNTNTLYLATYDDGVMKSTNGGLNWYPAGMSGEIILDVVVHPGNSNVLLSATINNGLWRSPDGGGSWAHSQDGLNASSVSSIAVQGGDSGMLFASLSPGWTQRSTDGGATWTDFHSGLPERTVNGLVAHPTENLVLYALTESSGLYIRHTTLSPNWVTVGSGLPSALVSPDRSDPPDPMDDFLGDYLPDLYNSDNKRESVNAQAPLLSMVFAPATPLAAYLGTGGEGVYKSTDDGASWVPSGLSGLTVCCLEVAPDNTQKIYACTDGSGSVRRTLNGGSTWTSLNLPSGTAYDLVIPAGTPSILYAATNVGVYKYDSVWTSSGLDGQHITAIEAHPLNPGWLYAGTTSGVYLSSDGGLTWEPGPTELDGVWVRSIQVDPNDPDTVYFSTYGHGVLRLTP